MRLIDADKLKVYRCDDSASRATFDYIYEDDVEDAPTIDIVRCGECKRRKKNGFCLEHNRYERNDDNFCSYGERSGNNDSNT